MANHERRRPWLFSLWRGLLLPLLVGAALLTVSYLIDSYRMAAHGAGRRAIRDLAGGLVLVAASVPIAIWAWRTTSWSRAFRYFIVWTVGFGSVAATLCVFLLDLQGQSGALLPWFLMLTGFAGVTLWIVGSWTCVIAMLMKAIRADRNRRSQAPPGTSPS